MPVEFDQRVRELFDQACDRPENERLAFLNKECQGDLSLYSAVERLLSARSQASAFINSGSQTVQRMGRYVIQGELGRGGMGIVYDAVDPVIGRSVAVKVINLRAISEPSQADFLRERLFREARSCGQLFHPGIVIVFDVGQEHDSAFIAMERVDGPSLHQLLSSGQRLATAEAVRILRQTAAALDYAHKNGIVHRDIKPANIMLRKDGAVKVTDFGIAKIMSSAPTTMTGAVMGTPSYMSPEQIEAREIDGRSDQFSLAVLAYELLTGTKPFQGDSIPSIAHLIVYGPRPKPNSVDPTLPILLNPVFEQAFSRLAEDRFATCADFTDALHAAFEKPPIKPPSTAPTVKQAARPEPRSSKALAATVIVFLALAGGAVFFYLSQKNQHPATIEPPPPVVQAKPPLTTLPQPQPSTATVQPSTATPAATMPVVIKQFRAEPDSVKTGTPAMLIWEVNGADKVTIDHGVGKVAAKGTFAVVPTVTTTYAITASNSSGSTHRMASIEVTPDPDSVPRSVRARQLFTEAQTKRHDGQTEEAASLFTRAAEMGDTGAMVELAEMYSSGEGVTEDESKAFNWFQRAANGGSVPGMVSLGGMYLLGANGADPNEEEAARWFQKAADHDSPAAMFDLAGLYESGRGVSKNLEKAKDLYQKSAKLGNREAQKRLAKFGIAVKN